MPHIPLQTFDQLRSEDNQNTALDRERTSEMMPQDENVYSKLVSPLVGIVWEADGKTFQFTFVRPQAEPILGDPVGSRRNHRMTLTGVRHIAWTRRRNTGIRISERPRLASRASA